ncbi:MAG: ribosome assembly factor SBDS [Candidatus ainarchaeum sp.]|nr:ribosome assembly factor SBDS [Candidatus ainarchaeum sp.]
MVKVDQAVIARIEKNGNKFEILVDPNLAMDLKHGKDVNFDELLPLYTIYKDSRAGEEQIQEKIKEAFKTDDIKVIVKKIIQDGEIQLTTEQRRKFQENKRLEIISFISKNAINPQTKLPHPPIRIENAIEQAKIHIDPFKSSTEQIPKIVDALKKILPISLEKVHFAVKIPAIYVGHAVGVIHKFEIKKEQYQTNGDLLVEFELPAGLKQDLITKLNSLTHGQVDVKIV